MLLSFAKRWRNWLCLCSLMFLFVNLSSAQVYDNPGGTITTCSGVFNDTGGSTGTYNINEVTTTSICPSTPGDCISVNFNSFNIESNYDYLYINQGVNTGTGSALVYTGTNSPGNIASYDPSGCLTFIFTSDGSVNNPGWSANISCGTCGAPPPASSADCIGAIPICSNTISVPSLTNGEGAFPNEYNAADPNMCLDTESQSTWYIFTANSTGNFGFLLTPNNVADDFDWAVFDLTNASCADIFNNTNTLLVSCNAAGGGGFIDPNACNGVTGANGGSTYPIQGAGCDTCPPTAANGCSTENALIPVVAGNTYVLYVSNWSGSGNGYTLDFSQSTVGIIDVTPPTLDQVYQPITCGATEITFEFSENVVCSSVQTSDFTLSGPGGPYTITNVSNPACDGGSNFGKVFTATITPSLTSNGTYSLSIVDEVVDNCSNITPENTLTFDITNLADASFAYAAATYCQSAIDPTPTITNPGGLFSFVPGGLVINTNTGTIDLDASAAGIYTITYEINSGGCMASSTQQVTISTGTTTNITTSNMVLDCDNPTTILDAGAGFSTYNWSNATSNQTTTVSNPGIYTVIVTDTNGCTGSASITITENTTNLSTTISSFGTTLTCDTTSLSLDAGTGFSTYSWSTAEATQVISTTTAGTYTVTVTDNINGCTGTASIVISENTTAPNTSISSISTELDCDNPTLVLDAGTGFGSYVWSTTETTQTISIINPGMYTVTITDPQNGCTSSASINITENTSPPSTSITSASTELSCTNTSILLDAGAGFDAYEWSTSETSQTISITSMGTYTVTITDNSNGCTAEASIVITQDMSAPVANITAPTMELTCDVTSIMLDAGIGFDAYAWSTSETTQTIAINSIGTYMVTVTDNSSGCTSSASINITENTTSPSTTITSASTELTCVTTSISLDAGTGFSAYNWSTAETTQNISIASVGTYTVTVTDNSNGCTGTASIVINENTIAPSTSISSITTELNCDNPTIILDAGLGFGTYVWSTTETTQTISVINPGMYTVIVTDLQNGCTSSASINITESTSPPSTIISSTSTEITCSNNSILLDAGAGFDAYAWSTSETTQTISITEMGAYTVTITDNSNGCTAEASIVITENIAAPSTAIIPSDTELTCDITSIMLDAGAGFANYQWSTSETSQTISINSMGTYSVTITDALNGCTGTAEIMIAQDNSLPVAQIIPSDAEFNCVVSNINLDASGSTGNNLTYEWQDGSTDTSLDITVTGDYSVTITNTVTGCTSSVNINIGMNTTTPTLVISPLNPVLNCTNPCTTLSLDNTMGNILWSDGSTADTLLACSAGTYAVTITDSNNGCTATASIEVTSSTTPPDVMINSIATVLDCNNTTLTLNASGTAGVNYEWSTGETTTSIIINTAGTYAVTATDPSTGCITGENITITESLINMPVITGDLIICDGESTTLDATTAGMTSYAWSTGETTASISVSTAGEYTVTISDGTCANSVSAIVVEAGTPSPTVTGDAVICEGSNTTLTATAGFDTYMWSNGMTSQTITVTNAGTYSVTVTNTEGCEGSNNFNVFVNASPTYNVIDDITICDNNTIAIGTINASGTTYAWTSEPNDPSLDIPSNATPSVSPTQTTTYYLTATNGICTEIDSVTITVEDPMVVAENTSICEGDIAIISAEGTPIGGTYVWTDWEGNEVGTGESINVDPLASTSYLVSYNIGNCNATAVVEVEVVTDPGLSITASSTEVFQGESTSLEINNVPDDSTIVWSSSNGDDPEGGAAVVVNPLENTIYSAEITTLEGCVYTIDILINVTETDFSIPNIFTPNGDDLNDNFYVVNLDFSKKVTEFKVFDRWGNVIHNAPNTPWNGTFKGNKSPSDVYVYLVRIESADGTEEFFKGDVTLMR